MKVLWIVGGLFVAAVVYLFVRAQKLAASAPPSAMIPGFSTTRIDPPSQGISTLQRIREAPKAGVCGAAAAYYTAGILKPVCGPVIGVTNALDRQTENDVKSTWSAATHGNVGAVAKGIVTAPLNQVKSVWNSLGL